MPKSIVPFSLFASAQRVDQNADHPSSPNKPQSSCRNGPERSYARAARGTSREIQRESILQQRKRADLGPVPETDACYRASGRSGQGGIKRIWCRRNLQNIVHCLDIVQHVAIVVDLNGTDDPRIALTFTHWDPDTLSVCLPYFLVSVLDQANRPVR